MFHLILIVAERSLVDPSCPKDQANHIMHPWDQPGLGWKLILGAAIWPKNHQIPPFSEVTSVNLFVLMQLIPIVAKKNLADPSFPRT